jgi:spore photoproduct lyase
MDPTYDNRPAAWTPKEFILSEVKKWIQKDDIECPVLNSGNLSDSFSFEKARPLMGDLVDLFRTEAEEKGRQHALLLVTKAGVELCSSLFERQPTKNVIISFSLNSPEAAADHEKGSAAVEDRIAAAKKLNELGWRIRVRLDPMILGYDYTWLGKEMAALRPERATMGTLRSDWAMWTMLPEDLKKPLIPPEHKRDLGRYPWGVRVKLYSEAAEFLKAADVPMGMCEERPEMWTALGLDPIGARCNCQDGGR